PCEAGGQRGQAGTHAQGWSREPCRRRERHLSSLAAAGCLDVGAFVMTNEGARTYPMTVSLGGREVTLRLMDPGDTEAMLAFARGLPEHDLLFLRRDITREPAVEAWIRGIIEGPTTPGWPQ